MENKGLSAEQLNMIPHDVMVQMYLQQTEAYRTLLAQNNHLEQLMEHFGESFEDYLEDLMPWSDKLPDECRKKNF